MNINNMLKQKCMKKYRPAKPAGVPHTTVNDICSGKARIEKCSGDTLYKLAKVLDAKMEALMADAVEYRHEFEIFKSNVCHSVRDNGDLNFIIETLESGKIRKYYDRAWYPEALYLLAMTDYLCRENDLPVCAEYADMRRARFREPIYPAGVNLSCAVFQSDEPRKTAYAQAIPEFRRFNIIESDVRNVV